MRPTALLRALLATAALAITAPAQAQQQDAPAPLPAPAIALKPKAGTLVGFLDCLDAQNATIISAHRGGPKPGYPENAIETFAYTLSRIPALLEMDVARTKDGALVLLHDNELGRTTTGSGPVGDRTLAQLAELQLVDNYGWRVRPAMRIPTLQQALDWARDKALIQLDIKRGVPVEEVVKAVQAAGAQTYASIIVDSPEEAARVVALDPVIGMSIGISKPEDLAALDALKIPHDRIYAFTGVNTERPAVWALLEEKGIPAIFATLWAGDREIAATNDEAKYARLSEAGVDVMVTDRHFDAYWAMEQRQDIEMAVKACVVP